MSEKPIAKAVKSRAIEDTLSRMVFTELSPRLAKAISDNVDKVCMKNKFKIDGYELTWKRIGKGLSKQLNKLMAEDVEFPENITTDEEKNDYIQREYLKLCFDGMTDQIYDEMDLGAIEVLVRAPIVRQRGLFCQE